jgi:hypothetical protein
MHEAKELYYVKNTGLTGGKSFYEPNRYSGLSIAATTNQLVLGTTNTVTINSPAPAAARILTLPVMTDDGDVIVGYTDSAAYRRLQNPIALPNRYTASGGTVTSTATNVNSYNGNLYSNKIMVTSDRCNPLTEKFLSYTRSLSNISADIAYANSSADGRIIVCTLVSTGYPIISYNYGVTFANITAVPSSQYHNVGISSDGSVMVLADYGASGLVWVSRDYGSTWTSAQPATRALQHGSRRGCWRRCCWLLFPFAPAVRSSG